MKLSISNIGWAAADDAAVYGLMKQYGFTGLEIAPTRVFPEKPYEDPAAAGAWRDALLREHGFVVPSMQSIWYGRGERIFGSGDERRTLIDYTRRAVDFAEAIGCENLVFGCPGNRSVPEGGRPEEALDFFRRIGRCAAEHHCVIAMEANPTIYNTNFLNTTSDALDYVEAAGAEGLMLNLDVGTMVQNGESIDVLKGRARFIHHVHISEPRLAAIQKRPLHRELAAFLEDVGYPGFVSIEVGHQDDIQALSRMMEYVSETFLYCSQSECRQKL